MADLFGSPQGEIAYNDTQLTQAKAQLTLGQLAEVPSNIQYRQALTQDVNSQAALRNIQVRQAQVELDFNQRASDLAAAQGAQRLLAANPTATVADIPEEGLAQRPSGATAITARADLLESMGAPLHMTAPLRKQAADIMEKENIGYYRQAQGDEIRQKSNDLRLKDLGNAVAAAGTNEQSWLNANSAPRISAMLPKELLGMPFAQAKPYLDLIRDTAIGAVKQQELQRAADTAKSQNTLRAQQVATAQANAGLIKVKTQIASGLADRLEKYDGERSGTAVEAKQAAVEAKQQHTQAQQLIAAPPAPLDQAKRKPGQAYTSVDGKTQAIWGGIDPVTKQPVWRPMPAGPARKPLSAALKAEAERALAGQAEAPEENANAY